MERLLLREVAVQQSARERAAGSPRQREGQHIGQGIRVREIEIARLKLDLADGVTGEESSCVMPILGSMRTDKPPISIAPTVEPGVR